MDNKKFETILDRLLKLSEEGLLNWKTTASPKTYLISLKGSSVSITNFELGIEFDFRNERGQSVETYSTYNVGEVVDRASDVENMLFGKANKLYDLAKRKALNADETIDRILEQLNPESIAA